MGTKLQHSSHSRKTATFLQKQRKRLKEVTCYRCRDNVHYSSDCRDPIKCNKCYLQGHRAWECTTKPPSPPSAPSSSSPLPHRASLFSATAMPRHRPSASAAPAFSLGGMGDPKTRPRERFTTFVATPAMEHQASLLASNAAVLWLGGSRPDASDADIMEEIHVFTRIEKELFRVAPHFPEDFIVRFVYPHHRDLLTAAPGRFGRGRFDIHVNKWHPNAHVDVTKLNYHVHLALDYVPLHGWDDELISDLIGDDCVLHYFDAAMTQKEDATAVKLWAWCSDPALIPRVNWLSIIDKPQVRGTHPSSGVAGRTCLVGRVIIHLELLEDFTPDASGKVPRLPRVTKSFRCRLGVIDGESERREGSRPSAHDHGHGRRDDDRDRRRDDDDDDRRGRDDGRSWASRLFRSRSRAPAGGSRREERHRDERGADDRRGDMRREDDRRDRRRELPDRRSIDTRLVQRLPGGAVIPAAGRRPRPSPSSPPRCELARLSPGEERGRLLCHFPLSSALAPASCCSYAHGYYSCCAPCCPC